MNMDRAIFDLKASVEATSLYIIICSFLDEGIPPNLSNVRMRWNGTDENLMASLEELSRCGVLETKLTLREDETLGVTSREQWSCR